MHFKKIFANSKKILLGHLDASKSFLTKENNFFIYIFDSKGTFFRLMLRESDLDQDSLNALMLLGLLHDSQNKRFRRELTNRFFSNFMYLMGLKYVLVFAVLIFTLIEVINSQTSAMLEYADKSLFLYSKIVLKKEIIVKTFVQVGLVSISFIGTHLIALFIYLMQKRYIKSKDGAFLATLRLEMWTISLSFFIAGSAATYKKIQSIPSDIKNYGVECLLLRRGDVCKKWNDSL